MKKSFLWISKVQINKLFGLIFQSRNDLKGSGRSERVKIRV
jgi:hypothetical protein